MPEAEVNHFITDKDLTTIRDGGRNYLFDVSLATFGASIGFIQNFFNLVGDLSDEKISSGWTYWGAAFFLVLSTATICLFLAGRKKRSPLSDLADEIESRPLQDFEIDPGTQDGTQ